MFAFSAPFLNMLDCWFVWLFYSASCMNKIIFDTIKWVILQHKKHLDSKKSVHAFEQTLEHCLTLSVFSTRWTVCHWRPCIICLQAALKRDFPLDSRMLPGMYKSFYFFRLNKNILHFIIRRLRHAGIFLCVCVDFFCSKTSPYFVVLSTNYITK